MTGEELVALHPGYDALRQNANLSKRINVIWVVQSCLKKYSAMLVGQIISTTSRHPVPNEGRIAIVTDVGTGCGGRGSVARATWLQGGFNSVSNERRARRATQRADGEVVWSWHPLLMSSRRRFCEPNRALTKP
jgi:hypothetical protein